MNIREKIERIEIIIEKLQKLHEKESEERRLYYQQRPYGCSCNHADGLYDKYEKHIDRMEEEKAFLIKLDSYGITEY